MEIQLISLLLAHFLCNAQAAQQPLSSQDAAFCSRNFEVVKTVLHPELSQSDLAQLTDSQRSGKSVEAYLHYRRWISENPELEAHLEEAVDKLVSPPTGVASN